MQLNFVFGWVLHMCDQSHPRSLRSYKMGVCENNISEDLLQYPLRGVSGLHFPMPVSGSFTGCADFIAQPCLSARLDPLTTGSLREEGCAPARPALHVSTLLLLLLRTRSCPIGA